MRVVSSIITFILLIVIVFNIVHYFLVTSDIPIVITHIEFVEILICNLIQLIMGVVVFFTSHIIKKSNIFVFFVELVMLYVWYQILKSAYMYFQVEYLKWSIWASIISLILCLLLSLVRMCCFFMNMHK